ncbi:cyclodeaminase/cyclohydrolase family protein [Microbacterium murale]|uniref:Formiminotetrahydrofolate cyclodeaminase n=1 Tax=Microbacterium murale TaxID=1081040 RepID=A0ABU0PG47_9MICO|nr:cyclodeaminase/cyclohydrolase family protein [Microbacterium murale]MDQ0645626.1 formiminotetrahydrofolate cyclodeaminase [Microbacterium murale]
MSENIPVSATTPLSVWLTELAQPTGAPGGGAASGVMFATSAALLRMVAEYTPDDSRSSECAKRLVSRRQEALEAAESDGVRSVDFGAALGLPADAPERDARVRHAALAAARASLQIGEVGRGLLTELRLIAEIGKPQLAADVAVAAVALAAGIGGASINLRANLQTARKHGASQTGLTGLQAEVRRLVVDRDAATKISVDASANFDE